MEFSPKYDLAEVAARLEGARTTNPSGDLAFEARTAQIYQAVLAASASPDEEITEVAHRVVLEQLRDVRNRTVHQGTDNSAMMSDLHFLRWFVEKVILFHIDCPIECRSLSDAALVLDQPNSRDGLARAREALMTKTRLIDVADRWWE